MALPLKSGADLYNQQLIRAAIWNNSADVLDPKEYATGLMYFNTNPSSNMYQKLRFRTGTDWKTIAFAEDLDVATNADFIALKQRVDAFLDGEVDSNGVLDNLKEIQKFLDNYSSATDLTAILDTKLDKSGGTIGDYTNAPLTIKCITANAWAGIRYQSNDIILGGIGVDNGTPIFINKEWNKTYPILHSGNVGEYEGGIAGYICRFRRDSTTHGYIGLASASNTNVTLYTATGSINMVSGGKDAMLINSSGNVTIGSSDLAGTSAKLYVGGGSMFGIGYQNNITTPTALKTNKAFSLVADNASPFGLHAWIDDAGKVYFQASYIDASHTQTYPMLLNPLGGNVLIGTTTDSGYKLDVNGEIRVLSLRSRAKDFIIYGYDGTDFVNAVNIDCNNSTMWIGYGSARRSYNTNIAGNNVYLRYGTSHTTGFILNPSGNVTIGYADFARSKWKTFITGNTFVYSLVDANDRPTLGNIPEGVFSIGYHSNGNVLYGLHMWSENSGNGVIQASRADGTAKIFSILLNPLGGKVGIGLTSPSAQLHVANDIVANGTVACKGVAAEGSAPVGTVDKWAGSIASGTKSQTYTHGLGTTDITVAIYEKNGNEWVQILTDVDIVNANTIRVTFGANTTVEHRIVVMG